MKRFPFGWILLITVVFIGFGDAILPASIGRYSANARSGLNDLMIGLFPDWRPKTKPNARTQESIDRLENKQKPAQ